MRFECADCSKVFKSRGMLSGHVRYHERKGPCKPRWSSGASYVVAGKQLLS